MIQLHPLMILKRVKLSFEIIIIGIYAKILKS